MEGRPEYVKSFVKLLKPETVYMRLNTISKWIEQYLQTWDSVSLFRVQEEVEQQLARAVDDKEVLDAFRILSETGRYTPCKLSGKPALKHATQAERSKRLLRRRWVEFAALAVGLIGSVAIWQLRPRILQSLPNHWVSWLISTVVCVLFCQAIAKVLRKIGNHTKYK